MCSHGNENQIGGGKEKKIVKIKPSKVTPATLEKMHKETMESIKDGVQTNIITIKTNAIKILEENTPILLFPFYSLLLHTNCSEEVLSLLEILTIFNIPRENKNTTSSH